MSGSLASFVDEIPQYKIKDGNMHISMGGGALVFPVHVFIAGMLSAEAEIAKWQLSERRENNVVSLDERRA